MSAKVIPLPVRYVERAEPLLIDRYAEVNRRQLEANRLRRRRTVAVGVRVRGVPGVRGVRRLVVCVVTEQTMVSRPVEHPLPPLTPAADFEDMPPWWQWAEAQLALDDTAASAMEWT